MTIYDLQPNHSLSLPELLGRAMREYGDNGIQIDSLSQKCDVPVVEIQSLLEGILVNHVFERKIMLFLKIPSSVYKQAMDNSRIVQKKDIDRILEREKFFFHKMRTFTERNNN